MIQCTLGVDLGTSRVKAALLDLDTFKLGHVATWSYDNAPHQSSEMLWEATAAAIREAVGGMEPHAIRSISISGQMYGKPIYNLLEHCFQLLLAHARHIKAVPGRKSDVRDSKWLAELQQHGLLHASFVPERAQREEQRVRQAFSDQAVSIM